MSQDQAIKDSAEQLVRAWISGRYENARELHPWLDNLRLALGIPVPADFEADDMAAYRKSDRPA